MMWTGERERERNLIKIHSRDVFYCSYQNSHLLADPRSLCLKIFFGNFRACREPLIISTGT
jgi:hypothetical protein